MIGVYLCVVREVSPIVEEWCESNTRKKMKSTRMKTKPTGVENENRRGKMKMEGGRRGSSQVGVRQTIAAAKTDLLG